MKGLASLTLFFGLCLDLSVVSVLEKEVHYVLEYSFTDIKQKIA